jgi:hypothetical protein
MAAGLQQSIQEIVNQQNSKIIKSDELSSYSIDLSNRFLFTLDEEGRYHSYNNEPAIVYMDSDIKIWMEHGKTFKKNGYSIITKKGKYLFDNLKSKYDKLDMKLIYNLKNKIELLFSSNINELFSLKYNLNLNITELHSLYYNICDNDYFCNGNTKFKNEYINIINDYDDCRIIKNIWKINFNFTNINIKNIIDELIKKYDIGNPNNPFKFKLFLTDEDINEININIENYIENYIFNNNDELKYLLKLNNITINQVKNNIKLYLNNYDNYIISTVISYFINEVCHTWGEKTEFIINNFKFNNTDIILNKLYQNLFKNNMFIIKEIIYISVCNKCNQKIKDINIIANKHYCHKCYDIINQNNI